MSLRLLAKKVTHKMYPGSAMSMERNLSFGTTLRTIEAIVDLEFDDILENMADNSNGPLFILTVAVDKKQGVTRPIPMGKKKAKK